jgi:hypothetical protein
MFWDVWLTGGSHAQNFQSREAPTRLIRSFDQEAGTGLPALLLSSEKYRRYLECRCEHIFAHPQIVMGTAIGDGG